MSDESHPKRGGPVFDPALWRGLTQRRMSRRDALGVAGKGAGLISMAALLASCGIAGSAERRGAAVDWATFWKEQMPTKQLNFANWPLYIDSEHGKTVSLELFTKATGIKVAYDPVIQGDDSFYATVEPELAAQEVTGYDLMVITNGWYFTQLVNNGFLNELDLSRLPNFFKYASPLVKNPSYDPGNKHSVTWQTGFTGIAYNTKMIKLSLIHI